MNKSLYKVTVVTVVFNDIANIANTIKSIVNQSYSNVEYIIIDGNSNDGTIEVIKKYSDKISKWISESDSGIYDAMNKGISLATGEYIIFMNSGDVFVNENVLSDVFLNITQFPDVIYGHTIGKHKNGRLRQKLLPFYDSENYCPAVGICHQSVLVKTEKAKSLFFDLSYKVCADHKMLYDLYRNGALFYEYKGDIAEIICDVGFSDKQFFLKLKERGRIYTINNSVRFKLFLYKSYLFYHIRSYLKKFEPDFIRNYRFKHKKQVL